MSATISRNEQDKRRQILAKGFKPTEDVLEITEGLHPICSYALNAFAGKMLTPSQYWLGLRDGLRRAHNELLCLYPELEKHADDSEAVALRLRVEWCFLNYYGRAGLKTVANATGAALEHIITRINADPNRDPGQLFTVEEMREVLEKTLDVVQRVAKYLNMATMKH